MSLFSKGFNNVREEQKRQEESFKRRKGQLFKFFLTNNQPDGTIVFLHNEPITFAAHTVKNSNQKWETKICVAGQDECEYCNRGDKPALKGAYIIIDRTPFEVKDPDGKSRINEGQLKLYIASTRVLSQLDRKNSKNIDKGGKGLIGKEWDISRTGSGTNTMYEFEMGDEFEVNSAVISDLLNEELQQFAPKNDSPAEIERAMTELLKEQLNKMLPYEDNSSDSDEEDEENEESQPKRNSLIGRRIKR